MPNRGDICLRVRQSEKAWSTRIAIFSRVLKSIRGGKFKVHFVNKLYSVTTTSIWI